MRRTAMKFRNRRYHLPQARNLAFLLVFVMAVGLTIPALAASGEVTSGEFQTFAAGNGRGYEISGKAHMTRTADGKTIVSVHVKGLEPETAYGVHVHNKACGDANGGGHYQEVVGGGVDPYNEIWPLFTTNEDGIGNGKATHDFRARVEAQSVVVHDTDGARIACADLD
jgi:hypothetical protein